MLLPPAETKLLAPPTSEVTDKDFEEVVRGALEAVGGTLLFKIRIGADREGQHVAAAAVGDGVTQAVPGADAAGRRRPAEGRDRRAEARVRWRASPPPMPA